MAAVWGIDIGHSALKAAKLNRTREGLEIVEVAYIPMDGGEVEEDRPEQVRKAIKDFLEKHSIRSEKVAVALPGLHCFSRFIKLPPVESKKIDEMIRYEAQQQIPFPIEDVMWGYHKVEREYEPGEEIEVGIFAAKRELILGFLSELREHGLYPDLVTIAPLAIYNFVTYNTELKADSVILDIGAKHTDLLVVQGSNFWIRNLRIAGGDVTQALADQGNTPYHQAERFKRRGLASEKAKVFLKSIERVLKDFCSQIQQSVRVFKSQADGLNVRQALLLGDGSKLRNIKPVFEKQLRYRVHKFTKLENDRFVVGENADFDVLKNHILSFGVALGLGIQGVGLSKTNLNLLPQEDQIVGELKRKVPFAALTALLCWGAFGLCYLSWTKATASLNTTIKASRETNSLLGADEQARQAADVSAIEAEAEGYRKLLDKRLLPLEIMNRLQEILPQDNAKIVSLEVEARKDPTAKQIEALKPKRKAAEKDKFWVLQLKVKRSSPPLSSEPDAPPPQLGYQVQLLVARQLQEGEQRVDVFSAVKKRVFDRVEQAFAQEPFWVRKPGKDRADPTKPEVEPGKIVNIYALDRSETAGKEVNPFEARMFELSFEVGVRPPAAEQKTE